MSFVVHYGQALLYVANRRHIIQTVTISLYRFDGVMRQLWAFAMMGLARQKLNKLTNLRFWKLLGSGTDQFLNVNEGTHIIQSTPMGPGPGPHMFGKSLFQELYPKAR